NNPRRPYY
ncbi:Splicing factor 4, partial [Danaus plexippus plexippus]